MSVSTALHRIAGAYRTLAIMFLNTLLLLLFINLVASGVRSLRERRPFLRDAEDRKMRGYFPHLSDEEFFVFLKEHRTLQHYGYNPWAGVQELPAAGKFLTVSPEGFRLGARAGQTLKEPWLKVFVYGGSTTFGVGCDNAWTIPSRLEHWLRVLHPDIPLSVYNWGHSSHYSRQELATFTDHLATGTKPDVAIFLDGVNELQVEPENTSQIAMLFDAFQNRRTGLWLPALEETSLGYAVAMAAGKRGQPLARFTSTEPPLRNAASYDFVRHAIAAIARQNGVEAWSFVQPIPGYRNPFAKHEFLPDGMIPTRRKRLDDLMRMLEQGLNGDHALSLAGLLEHWQGQPFVDDLHYTEDVNDLIASAIAKAVRLPPSAAKP